jgi:hypothetical protein
MMEPLPLVLSSEFVTLVIAKFVDVAAWSEVLPETVMPEEKRALPVVVAPPKMVRPVACAPAPMVDDARAVRPPLKERSVDVAFAGNGHRA